MKRRFNLLKQRHIALLMLTARTAPERRPRRETSFSTRDGVGRCNDEHGQLRHFEY